MCEGRGEQNGSADESAHGSRRGRSASLRLREAATERRPVPVSVSVLLSAATLHPPPGICPTRHYITRRLLSPGGGGGEEADASRPPPEQQELRAASAGDDDAARFGLKSRTVLRLCCRGLKDSHRRTQRGWKPESSGDESSLRVDFAGVLPEASGKDNTGIHSPSRGPGDNSHLRRFQCFSSEVLCFNVKLVGS